MNPGDFFIETCSPHPWGVAGDTLLTPRLDVELLGRLRAAPIDGRPMRGLKQIRSVHTIAAGHAFVQNLRRGHYELTADVPGRDPVRVAFTELAQCL